MKDKDKDTALMLACMLGHQSTDSYSEGVFNSVDIYKELTGEDLGLKREPKKYHGKCRFCGYENARLSWVCCHCVKEKWYFFWLSPFF